MVKLPIYSLILYEGYDLFSKSTRAVVRMVSITALVDLLNKLYPSYRISEHIGNFTILPDGSLLSMHYLYTA